MAVNVFFAADRASWPDYEAPLREAFDQAGIEVELAPDMAPDDVDYIIYAPNSKLSDFQPYTRAKAVLNLWAGVEAIVGNPTLTIPLCRMVDPALTQGMVEWVTGHALRHHLGMDAHILAKPGEWKPVAPPVAWDRRVSVLGLGELGAACARQLSQIGFQVTGWSRTSKTVDNVKCECGDAGLEASLRGAEIVVLLLPDTSATSSVVNARTLAMLAPGAVLINPGRGSLIDDEALLEALDTPQISHATLDVFRKEPLPADHPYWHHPKVTVTPHIASETRPRWSAVTIAENVRRGETGEHFLHRVDPALGY